MNGIGFFHDYLFFEQVKILMERCWSADPSERPDFESLIKKFQSLRQAYWQSFS